MCEIGFFIPFCNQKRYFTFFSFWLDEMVMSQKQQIKLPIIWELRIRKTCQIEFSYLLVILSGIFRFQALFIKFHEFLLLGFPFLDTKPSKINETRLFICDLQIMYRSTYRDFWKSLQGFFFETQSHSYSVFFGSLKVSSAEGNPYSNVFVQTQSLQ